MLVLCFCTTCFLWTGLTECWGMQEVRRKTLAAGLRNRPEQWSCPKSSFGSCIRCLVWGFLALPYQPYTGFLRKQCVSWEHSPLVLNDSTYYFHLSPWKILYIFTCSLSSLLVWAYVSSQKLAWVVTLPARSALCFQRAARQDRASEFGRQIKAVCRLQEKQLLHSWEAFAESQSDSECVP